MINKLFPLILIIATTTVLAQTKYVDEVFKYIDVKTYNYSIRENDTLKFDFYEPIEDTLQKRPLFVIIHGGGFTTGERNDSSLVHLADDVAKKGYAVASIDYRLLNKNEYFSCNSPSDEQLKTYSKASIDLLDALLYITTYKTDFKIDDSKIILFGISAGAETILNITYNRVLVVKDIEKYKNIKPAAVVSISGAILNTDYINKENAVPGVFYHGVDDPIIPFSGGAHHSCSPMDKGYLFINGSKKITDKLKALNTSFMLYSYKNRGHDIFNLPSEDFYQSFLFLRKVVFDQKFFQAEIVEQGI